MELLVKLLTVKRSISDILHVSSGYASYLGLFYHGTIIIVPWFYAIYTVFSAAF